MISRSGRLSPSVKVSFGTDVDETRAVGEPIPEKIYEKVGSPPPRLVSRWSLKTFTRAGGAVAVAFDGDVPDGRVVPR